MSRDFAMKQARARVPGMLLLVLAAALVRLWGLGNQGLWADEAGTVVWAQLPLPALMQRLAGDNQAPALFVLLHIVFRLLEPSEWLARLPSALAGLLTVLAVFRAGLRAGGFRCAVAACALFSFSPTAVHYAREARGYALLTLGLAMAVDAVLRMRNRPDLLSVAYLVAGGTLMLYAHNVGVVYLAAVLAWGFLEHRNAARRAVVGAGVLTALAYAPWAVVVVMQMGKLHTSYAWLAPSFAQQFPWQIPMSWATLSPLSPPPVRNGISILSGPAMVGGVLTATVFALGARRHPGLRVVAPWLALVLVPLVVIFAASVAGTPVYGVGRVEAAAIVPLCLGMGVVAAAWPNAPRAALLVACGAGALFPLQMELTVDTRSQERAIARGIARVLEPRDVMVVATAQKDTLSFYVHRSLPDVVVRGFPASRDVNAFWIDPNVATPEALGAEAAALAPRLAEAAARTGASVVVVWQDNHEGRALVEALGSHMRGTGALPTGFLGLTVSRYAAPVPPSH